MKALIFDCDGVLVDTERDGHRVAFNRTFKEAGLDVYWGEERYGELLKISGGKERMRHYFKRNGWPAGVKDRDAFIKDLHTRKTVLFMEIIENRELPLRSGVARLVDEAIEADLRLGVCSTSNVKAVTQVVEKMLGPDRGKHFSFILAGDVVSAKKPDPEIYRMAQERLRLPPEACLVVEDTRNGLLAARGAEMACLITKSYYTGDEDFTGALLVVDELGDPPAPYVTLEQLRGAIPSFS